MADDPKRDDIGGKWLNGWELVTRIYGPYAFGLVSILLIWFFIVGPELDRKELDFEKQAEIVESMKDIASTMRSTARSNEVTATMLNRTIERLDKMDEKK
jgi:hypothetical protein